MPNYIENFRPGYSVSLLTSHTRLVFHGYSRSLMEYHHKYIIRCTFWWYAWPHHHDKLIEHHACSSVLPSPLDIVRYLPVALFSCVRGTELARLLITSRNSATLNDLSIPLLASTRFSIVLGDLIHFIVAVLLEPERSLIWALIHSLLFNDEAVNTTAFFSACMQPICGFEVLSKDPRYKPLRVIASAYMRFPPPGRELFPVNRTLAQ